VSILYDTHQIVMPLQEMAQPIEEQQVVVSE
jgi:hypothetical protein